MPLKAIVQHVRDDGVAVIFPQDGGSGGSNLMSSGDASGMLAAQCGGEVVPVRVSGSLYSRYALTSARWPKRYFPQITICVHAPVRIAHAQAGSAKGARRARALALQSVMHNLLGKPAAERTLFDAYVDALALYGRRTQIIEDARREPQSYGQLLRVALALGRLVVRNTDAGETVGVLMPSTAATLGLMLGLTAHGRVAAMLNYSAGVAIMRNACVAAGVRTLITSQQFLAALGIQDLESKFPDTRVLYVETLRQSLTLADKLWVAAYAQWCPRAAVARVDPQQPAVVLFTSGSEGAPKGVVLSHAAMMANMAQLQSVIDFGPDDKFFSALPLYHIFGLVACSLMPLMTGTPQFLYVSPLRYRAIPALVTACGATYLFGTSTFLSHYARQAQAGDFRSLRRVICGGEKLHAEVARLWNEKFGLSLFEGYGATECGPAMSLNTPLAFKRDTVGRFLPHIEYRLIAVPGINTGGALHVRGPNLMSGYLCSEQPGELVPPRSDAGAGWHDTGDIVEIDAEGFVTVIGRTRRFAKIAGEMISLDAVERVAYHASPQYRHAAIMARVPAQGEDICLFTTDAALDRAALLRAARECDVSHLAAARTIQCVNELPQLGNGKTDYVTLTASLTSLAMPAAR
jgi:acyl-[acyl-carrier-protein]-phospholipid O-acyltransferase/long-chain-fatty-acid--[acyl-carrier-protein] ligase